VGLGPVKKVCANPRSWSCYD